MGNHFKTAFVVVTSTLHLVFREQKTLVRNIMHMYMHSVPSTTPEPLYVTDRFYMEM